MTKGFFTTHHFYRCFLIAFFFFSACDHNIAPPAQPSLASLVSVNEFGFDQDNVTSGTIVQLSWNVTGQYSRIHIEPEIGDVQAVGSQLLKASEDVTYTLSVYAVDDQGVETLALTRNATVDVTGTSADSSSSDSSSDISADPSSDSSGADQPSVNSSGTYAFTQLSFSPTTPKSGDTVVVSWQSNFDQVTVSNVDQPFSGTDSYTFTADQTISMTLSGYVNGVQNGDPQSILITVLSNDTSDETNQGDIQTETSKIVSLSTSSNSVISGQGVTVNWETDLQNSSDFVQLNGSPVEQTGSQTFDANSLGDGNFSLEILGSDGGVIDQKTLSVSVAKFQSQSSLKARVTDLISTSQKEEYWYILNGAFIYQTTDDFASASTQVSTKKLSGTLTCLALSSDAQDLYVGTSDGLFHRSMTDDSFEQIASTGGSNSLTSVLSLQDKKHLLVSTQKALYEVYDLNDYPDCSDKAGDYCVVYIDLGVSPIAINKLIKNPKDSSQILVLTDNGVYQSSDDGQSFAKNFSLTDNFKGGFWDKKSGYIWSSSSLWKWNPDTAGFEEFSHLPVIQIYFARDLGSKTFVAADSGVWFQDQNNWVQTNLTEETDFLIDKDVKANTDTLKLSSLSSAYDLLGITVFGQVQELTWKTSQTYIFNKVLPQDFLGRF